MRHGAPVIQDADPQRTAEFEGFVRDSEPRLRFALCAAYGFEEGRDATAEAHADDLPASVPERIALSSDARIIADPRQSQDADDGT